MLIRLEPAGSRATVLNGTLGFLMLNQRQQLRSLIRQRRKQLSLVEQDNAAKALITRFTQAMASIDYQHIALYLSVDGEINTHPLIEWLWQQGKSVYLPVLHPLSPGHLLFLRYQTTTPLIYNHYSILEPKLDLQTIQPLAQLDVICTPLVAFDRQGQRLGMGGGYYDRTLAHWFKNGQGPLPIGLAHDCQYVDQLAAETWDVPLPKIITPSKVWQWKA